MEEKTCVVTGREISGKELELLEKLQQAVHDFDETIQQEILEENDVVGVTGDEVHDNTQLVVISFEVIWQKIQQKYNN